MQSTVATITKIDEKCNAFTLSMVNLQSINKGMVLMPGFDCDVLPLALIATGSTGKYELLDIRGKGWEGTMEGLDDVEVIGQPPDNPNWIFVKSLKSGALGILKCIQK